MGFSLTLKWGFSVHVQPSCPWPSSYSNKDRQVFYGSMRMSAQSNCYEQTVNYPLRAEIYSPVTQLHEDANFEKELLEGTTWKPVKKDNSKQHTIFEDAKALHFHVLMDNLNALEETIADSDSVLIALERDILVQLERFGALKLFQACLCRTLNTATLFDFSNGPTKPGEVPPRHDPLDDLVGKKIICSVKKAERKERRKRLLDKGSNKFVQGSCSKCILKEPQMPQLASGRGSPQYRSSRLNVAPSEAEMSQAVKMVAELEKIRMVLEENTGEQVSMSSWAEAARIDKQVLHKKLQFGWYFRDSLLRSTRSLVVYIANNYKGQGVALEDLVQAGNRGVLLGAERFDHTRGYKFSTYVQYWINKSMSALLSQHAREIRIPVSFSRAMKKIQQTQQALRKTHGKYPDVDQVGQLTGFSPAKITLARRHLRAVCSLDQNVGDYANVKLRELIPDTSVRSPEEEVLTQQMVQEIFTLLETLEPRERQILILRFGLGSHHEKSLEEIGKLFSISKEWTRKLQRSALSKLRKQVTVQNLSHYLHM